MAASAHYPTPFFDLNQVLHTLTESVQTILGADLVGVYLQGSFAGGDFDAYSDVDFLVVVERPITSLQRDGLQAMHIRIHGLDSSWAHHLEGSYMPGDLLRSWDRCQEVLPYKDNGSQDLVDSIHDNTLVVRWVVREQGIALVGPDPKTLLDPVPADKLRQEVLTTMEEWGAELLADPKRMNNRWYQPFAVLSYCRMLHTLQTGTVTSKPVSARWAQEALDPIWRDLIQRAWAERPNPSQKVRLPAEPDDLQRTRAFIHYALTLGQTTLPSGGALCQ